MNLLATPLTKGDRIAVDPVFNTSSITYGSVVRVANLNSIDVLYDGALTVSNIDPRIARTLNEAELAAEAEVAKGREARVAKFFAAVEAESGFVW